MKPDSMQYMESGFFIPNCAIEGAAVYMPVTHSRLFYCGSSSPILFPFNCPDGLFGIGS